MQIRLTVLGISSLGRAESYVLSTVDAVLGVMYHLTGRPRQLTSPEAAVIDFATGVRLLTEHTEALLGHKTPGCGVRIMVTMPSEVAIDYIHVH